MSELHAMSAYGWMAHCAKYETACGRRYVGTNIRLADTLKDATCGTCLRVVQTYPAKWREIHGEELPK